MIQPNANTTKVDNSKQNQSYTHILVYLTTSGSILFLYYTELYAYVDEMTLLYCYSWDKHLKLIITY